MTKNISIVTSVPLTEPVVRNRLFPFFEVFVQKGYIVRCICPQSNFCAEQLPDGVLLEQSEVDFFKPDSFIKRALKEAKGVAKLLKKAKDLGDEQVLVTIPSMFFAFLSPLYLHNQIAIIDVRDLSWEYLSENSLHQRLAKRLFRFWFKRSIGFFNLVAATNETELDYIRKIDKRVNPVHVSNGIRRMQFQQLRETKASEADQFTVAYVGNIGLAQKLDTLVEAARQLPELKFKIVGSGIDEQRVNALVQKYKLKNFEMIGRVSWETVLQYYCSAHVLYAQLSPDFSGAMPSKLYEYLATGKPIVYGGYGQAVDILKQFETCHVVTPCDPDVLVKKLSELCSNERNAELSNANKVLIEDKYIREDNAELLANEVKVLSMAKDVS